MIPTLKMLDGVEATPAERTYVKLKRADGSDGSTTEGPADDDSVEEKVKEDEDVKAQLSALQIELVQLQHALGVARDEQQAMEERRQADVNRTIQLMQEMKEKKEEEEKEEDLIEEEEKKEEEEKEEDLIEEEEKEEDLIEEEEKKEDPIEEEEKKEDLIEEEEKKEDPIEVAIINDKEDLPFSPSDLLTEVQQQLQLVVEERARLLSIMNQPSISHLADVPLLERVALLVGEVQSLHSVVAAVRKEGSNHPRSQPTSSGTAMDVWEHSFPSLHTPPPLSASAATTKPLSTPPPLSSSAATTVPPPVLIPDPSLTDELRAMRHVAEEATSKANSLLSIIREQDQELHRKTSDDRSVVLMQLWRQRVFELLVRSQASELSHEQSVSELSAALKTAHAEKSQLQVRAKVANSLATARENDLRREESATRSALTALRHAEGRSGALLGEVQSSRVALASMATMMEKADAVSKATVERLNRGLTRLDGMNQRLGSAERHVSVARALVRARNGEIPQWRQQKEMVEERRRRDHKPRSKAKPVDPPEDRRKQEVSSIHLSSDEDETVQVEERRRRNRHVEPEHKPRSKAKPVDPPEDRRKQEVSSIHLSSDEDDWIPQRRPPPSPTPPPVSSSMLEGHSSLWSSDRTPGKSPAGGRAVVHDLAQLREDVGVYDRHIPSHHPPPRPVNPPMRTLRSSREKRLEQALEEAQAESKAKAQAANELRQALAYQQRVHRETTVRAVGRVAAKQPPAVRREERRPGGEMAMAALRDKLQVKPETTTKERLDEMAKFVKELLEDD